MAEQDGQKLFLKRNSNPLLLRYLQKELYLNLFGRNVLKQAVVTAQHWKNGRELNEDEMNQTRVAELLHKIHGSRPLLTMLKRMEMEPITPDIMLNKN